LANSGVRMNIGASNTSQRSSHRIGQSTAEFAVLLALIAAAIIAMQVYIKRGLQGRIRNLADQISTEQYEEGRTESRYTTKQHSTNKQKTDAGVSQSSLVETTERSGDETVTPQENR